MTPTLPVLLLLLAPAIGEPKFQEFNSKDGGFKVLMPGKPVERIQEQKSAAGILKFTMYIVDLGQMASYIAAFNDFPDKVIEALPVAKHLDNCRDGNIKSFGKLISEKKITFGRQKHSGREILLEKADKTAQYRARIYLVGNRLYQIVLVGPREVVQADTATKYLESFQLTD